MSKIERFIDRDDRREMIDTVKKIIEKDKRIIAGCDESVNEFSTEIVNNIIQYLDVGVRKEYEDDPLREDPRAGVPDIEEESREC